MVEIRKPKKTELIKRLNKNRKELYADYPKSRKFAERAYLLNNKLFLGFFIQGNIPEDVMRILKKNFKGKILFDGKKTGVIG